VRAATNLSNSRKKSSPLVRNSQYLSVLNFLLSWRRAGRADTGRQHDVEALLFVNTPEQPQTRETVWRIVAKSNELSRR
jgi:hypothetical protein